MSQNNGFRFVWASAILWLGAVIAAGQGNPSFRVLLYSKGPAGEAYVHAAAKAALKDSVVAWGRQYGFSVDVAEDASVMTAANLAKYQAVVFNNISAEVVDALPLAAQRTALIDYMKTGGFLGMHAVSEAGRWADLVSALGAKMANHTSETNPATATLNADPQALGHPILAGLAATGTRLPLAAKVSLADEWYTFAGNPRGLPGVQILYTLDETTFTPAGRMGADHPIAWARTMPGGGRIFYTGIGHFGNYLGAGFTRSLFVNALFWTARMDASAGVVGGVAAGSNPDHVFTALSLGVSQVTVSVELEGPYRLRISDLEGRLLAARNGSGVKAHTFKGLGSTGKVGIGLESASLSATRLVEIR